MFGIFPLLRYTSYVHPQASHVHTRHIQAIYTYTYQITLISSQKGHNNNKVIMNTFSNLMSSQLTGEVHKKKKQEGCYQNWNQQNLK